jgi:hypothetical protein
MLRLSVCAFPAETMVLFLSRYILILYTSAILNRLLTRKARFRKHLRISHNILHSFRKFELSLQNTSYDPTSTVTLKITIAYHGILLQRPALQRDDMK